MHLLKTCDLNGYKIAEIITILWLGLVLYLLEERQISVLHWYYQEKYQLVILL